MKNTTSFIETQFPVSKISKESYKERKAGQSQTLTGLGKWWGRKPLVLVRATLLGLLMPSSDNPKRDQEIFLKIMKMDHNGIVSRKYKNPPDEDVFHYSNTDQKNKYFNNETKRFLDQTPKKTQDELRNHAISLMSYDEKLKFCKRAEEIEDYDTTTWEEINSHLSTSATNLEELFTQLASGIFGENIKVGDCFCGSGSIPYEAARLGLNTFSSDLNPIALLLSQASVSTLNLNNDERNNIKKFQNKIIEKAEKQIKEWKIENNEDGYQAVSYLYCNETRCPECDWQVPLLPNKIIGDRKKIITVLIPNEDKKNFDLEVKVGVSKEEYKNAKTGTVIKNNLVCPNCRKETPITVLRGDAKKQKSKFGLRKWDINEFLPQKEDVFKERLYFISYVDKNGIRHYLAPNKNDMERENEVISILKSHFSEWQEKGYIPSDRIKSGYNTDQLTRERGWQYWHQLFNPRQLLVHGLLMKLIDEYANNTQEYIYGLLGLNRCTDYNSRLSMWRTAREIPANTFYNQAFNTMFNFGSRGIYLLKNSFFTELPEYSSSSENTFELKDARNIDVKSDIWITDPPYADAVNYHELSEFFLAWDKPLLKKAFPEWYTDSKRALAVQGDGEDFRKSMVEVYSNLANHMSDNGRQVVMFTHQDPAVWAELTTILWAAGLQVTAAWNIATETSSGGLKSGNYVQGTVIMVLRKQQSDTVGYLDEVAPLIEEEVKNQIETMRDLDDKDDPNFTDADYLLAAYAASLKVLTSYKEFKEINLQHELNRSSDSKEKSEIQKIIEEAVKTAYDQLIPRDFDTFAWKSLKPVERFYIRGLELEKEGINKMSAYQELARGFGISNYTELMASTTANQARLKTPTEFGDRMLGDTNEFGKTLLRNVLKALEVAIKEEEPAAGKQWLKTEIQDYWPQRAQIITLLRYLSTLESYEALSHWKEALEQSTFVRALVEQDGV